MSAEPDVGYQTPKATKRFGERIDGGGSPLVGGSWRRSPCSPITELGTKSCRAKIDSYHIIHKVPPGDSPYGRAKHAQLINKDPAKSVPLFWAAINSNDRLDSALKDMAIVMKQLNRTEEAVEAIKSFRNLCSHEAQESLDNLLLDLYKRCGKVDEQIELLENKLKVIEESIAFNGRKTKITKSQGKKFYVPLRLERARLLGNIGWAYMQKNDFQTAETNYRKALSIEYDKNRECNLAICLMHTGKISEAKLILHNIKPSPETVKSSAQDSYIKSFERACEILSQLESPPLCLNENPYGNKRSDTNGGDPAFSDEMENISSSLIDMGLSSSAGKWRTRSQDREPFHPMSCSTHKAEKQSKVASSSFISKYTKWQDDNGVEETRNQETGYSLEALKGKTCLQASTKENSKGNSSNVPIKNQRWVVMVDNEIALTDSTEGEKKEQVAEKENLSADSIFLWNTEALSASNSRKTWADMVEEEDFLSNTSWNNTLAVERQDPSPKQSNFQIPFYGKQVSGSRKRFGDVFADENLIAEITRLPPSKKVQNSAKNQEQTLERVNLSTPHPTFAPGLDVLDQSVTHENLMKRRNRLRVFQEITLPDTPRGLCLETQLAS